MPIFQNGTMTTRQANRREKEREREGGQEGDSRYVNSITVLDVTFAFNGVAKKADIERLAACMYSLELRRRRRM